MAVTIKVEINEDTLKKLVLKYLTDMVGADLTETDIMIEVKSKQNYKSEWEMASFRAVVDKRVA